MKLGRHAKRNPTKISILGEMLRGWSRRERREKAKHIAAVRLPVKTPRQSFALEPVEPRLLMSADLSYASTSNNLILKAEGTIGAPILDLYDGAASVATKSLSAAGDVNVNITYTGLGGPDLSGDTLHIDLSNFSVLNTFVTGHASVLNINFIGGDERVSTDHVTIDSNSGALPYGMSIQSSSDIASSATINVTGDLTLKSEQTESDVLTTGLLANSNTGISLTGANLTTTGALNLTAHSALAVNTDGTGMSAIQGALITSFSASKVDIGGSSVLNAGTDINITSSVDGNLTASATGATVKLVVIAGNAAPEVTINGSSSLLASGKINVLASSDITIGASAKPGGSATDAKFDAAVLSTTFGSGATLSIAGSANLTATGSSTLGASSKLVSSTVADANVVGTAGAAVAVSVITGDTTASVDSASVHGSSVALTASSDRTITTTAKSAPGGSDSNGGTNKSEQTLADNKASTSDGNLTIGGAIAVSTDTGTTKAFLNNATIDAGVGAATVSASSVDVAALTADGEFTKKGSTGVGIGVAIGVADRSDLAYVSGNTDVTAGSLAVQVLAPKQSSFSAMSTAGVGDSSKVGVAGSLAINVTLFDHQAYLANGAQLTLHGNPNVMFEAHADLTNTAKALPADGGTADSVGIGASVAFNYGQDLTAAYIDDNATFAGTGAKNLTLTADADHVMDTEAKGGGKGSTAITPIVAISIAADDTKATLGSGGTLTIGGDFSASSTMTNTVTTKADGDTKSSKTGVGISIALSVVNDNSLATTGRDLMAAAGAAAFLSSAVTGSQSSAKASVAGGEPDDGSDQHDGNNDQSVDNKTKAQSSFGDKTASDQATKANPSATTKGTEGKNSPSASSSDGKVSVAGAIGINVELASSQAYIGNGRIITTSGPLTVKSSANVDGAATADGSAVIGEIEVPPAKVDTGNDTVDLGTSSGLSDGDKVTYQHGKDGDAIGGLTSGTDYYVHDTGGGKFELYDTKAKAQSHNPGDQIHLTSAGSGTQNGFKGAGAGGTSVGVAIAVNYAKETNLAYIGSSTLNVGGLDVEATEADHVLKFDPNSKVDVGNDTIDAGPGLRTGDAVVYHKSGASASIGGLNDGTTYYVNVQDDGKLKLYDTSDNANAGGTTGLIDLTSVVGTGTTDTLVEATSSFAAEATSGAGGGDTGVAGSLAFNIAFTDTEAVLGYNGAIPNVTITGGGDVTLKADSDVSNDVKAQPSDGGGDGTKIGVGISIGFNYGENSTLAQIADGVILTGAHKLDLDATFGQEMATDVKGGSKGATAVTPVVAIAITANDTNATLGTGAGISLTGGFSAQAALKDHVNTTAEGDTESTSTGVGISVAVTVVNDHALATTSRDLNTSGGAMTFSASTISNSESTAKASVKGGEEDNDSGNHDGANDQSVDNTTKKQSNFGDSKAKEEDNSAKGTEGSNSNDKAKSSNGSVSVAGAVAVNVEIGTAQAFIPNNRHITATGMLSVTSAAQVDGQALATGAATTSEGGTGVGIAVSVNVATDTNEAYIGNNTIISSGGLTVQAGMAERDVDLKSSTTPVIDTTKNTIFLGLDAGLKTGDEVIYHSEGNSNIGDLTDGTHYFVNVQDGGQVQFYDNATNAKAGKSAGLQHLTIAVGEGTQQHFSHTLFGIIPTGDINFNPNGSTRFLDLGGDSGLHTGDVVKYDNGGGSNMGGLANGHEYYIIEVKNGKFQLAATRDDAENGKAIVLGADGSSKTQKLIDETDNSRVEATSGGSGGKIGVSVSLGVNVVTNNTHATVGGSTAQVTITGGGNVALGATSTESNVARALPSSGGASGSEVGVGASVGINVITNHTDAKILDGTQWTGTAGSFGVAATSQNTSITHGENGAAGGGGSGVGVGVGVAVAVIQDTTAAYVGTTSSPDIAATGNVSITADHTATFKTTTSAEGAGKSVGVGASVSVAVVVENVSAELARGIHTSGGAVSVTSNATISSDAEAVASSSGEDKTDSQANSKGGKSGADGQADHQVNDNSTTQTSTALPSANDQKDSANSDSSSQGGGDSGGVSVAASVSVNVLVAHNTASVTHGADITAHNAVTIETQAEIDATSKAVGSSVSIDSNSDMIGVGVSVNVVNASNKAFVDTGSAITGKGITIEAITPASKTDDFISWGAAAAGGKGDASVAGSVSINVVSTFDTEASARSGTTLNSTGNLTVMATSNVNIQTLAAAGAFSDGTSIGAAVAVAVLNVSTQAYIAGNADATGAMLVDAEIHLDPQQLALPKVPDAVKPSATTIAVAGAAGTGSAAIAGSFIVDVFTLHVDAYIDANSQINQSAPASPSQTISVHAVNESTITTIAGALGVTTGSVGVGASLDLEIINKETKAYIGNSADAKAGGGVDLDANSSETMISVTATVGGGDTAGIAATADIAVINTDTEATIGSSASVLASGAVSAHATSAFKTTMIAGSVGVGSTAGVGAANATLVHSATTLAYIDHDDTVTAGTAGGVSIVAHESEDVLSIVAGIAVGGTAGVAGSAAVNVLTEHTTAYIGHSSILTVTLGGVTVGATDDTSIISIAGSLAVGGSAGVGVGADVGVYNKHTNAYIGSGVTVDADGDIQVSANTSEDLISVSAGIAVGSVAVGVNAGVHVFTLQTRAFIGDDPDSPTNSGAGNVHAGGSVAVAANDQSNVDEIVGALAAGSVGVAAGAGVNVSTKETKAFIGNGAQVSADGNGSGLTVNTGRIDTNFGAAAPFSPNQTTAEFASTDVDTGADTIHVGGSSGFHTGDRVIYAADSAGTAIGGLTDHGAYYVRDVGGGDFKLYHTADDANGDIDAINLTSQGTGSHQSFKSSTGIETSDASSLTAAGSGDRSSFKQQGKVGTPSLAGMDLKGDGNSQQVDDNSLTGVRSATPGTQSGFHGVAVSATNRDEIRTFTITFGAGSVGIAVSAGVDVVTADTEAYVGGGAVVNATGIGADSVLLGAGDDFYHLSVGIGVGVGAVGIAPAVGVNVISNTTAASIGNNATVNANNDIVVEATGSENVVMVGIGVAAGSVGVGAVVDVLSISNHTAASIGSSAIVHGGGDVFVSATDDTHVLELSGALAGGFVGVGGAVGVMLISKDTQATIGNNANVEGLGGGGGVDGVLNGNVSNSHFDTTTAHGVIVQAQSSEDLLHIVAAGGVGFVGVSGAVGVTLVNSSTSAVIGDGAQINQANPGSADPTQSVYVNASNDVTIQTFIIGVAGGFVGVTGAVDVGNLNNDIKAEVQANANVRAKNDVEVNAVGLKSLTGYTISGAGGFVGAGASVNVWSIGTTLEKQYSDNDGHSANGVHNDNGSPDDNAGDQAHSGSSLVTGNQGIGSFTDDGTGNANTNNNRVRSASQSASTGINSAAPSKQKILDTENNNPVPSGTSAVIRSGANVVAGDRIDVKANESATVKETLGQVAAGVVGAGAAVDILSVAANVTASDDGTNHAGGDITVKAILNEDVHVTALDLAAGFVGLGAGVIVVTDTSATQATLGSVSGAHNVTVSADSTRGFDLLSGQASIGAVGVGATFTRLNVHGFTTATVDAGAVIGSIGSPVASLSVTAHSTINSHVQTYAVSAGIGATNANFTFVTVDPNVAATIDTGASVDAINGVSVSAKATFDEHADTFGVSAGGLAVGVSFTDVTVAPTIQAEIGDSVSITAGSLSVTASDPLPGSGYTAQATATGSAGALIGVTSTNSSVTDNSHVISVIGTGAQLAIAGATAVTALNTTRQRATADSNSFGLVAAGIATSHVDSHTVTSASLGSNATMSNSGNLTISAVGHDDNFAYTNAGSGGLIAGSASVAHTTTDSTTTASIGDGSNITLNKGAGALVVGADQTATFNSQITTFAGGLLAGAGGEIVNNVNANTTAAIGSTSAGFGQGANVTANSVKVTATSHADKPWLTGGTPENIKGTTGGLASGAGGSDTTTIAFTTQVIVGNYADVTVPGASNNNVVMTMAALNDFNVYDKVAFATAGAISGASVGADIVSHTDLAKVLIGSHATLFSSGQIVLSSRGQGNVDQEVSTEVYGAGTATLGHTTVDVRPDNEVKLGSFSTLTAYGDLNLSAGTDAASNFDSYSITSRYDGFAGSLIPISSIHATAYLIQTDHIVIDAGAHASTARSANLVTDQFGSKTVHMLARAQAESWVSDLSAAILKAQGGGALLDYGDTDVLATTQANIENNGIVETGINRNLHLILGDGNLAHPGGWDQTTGLITVSDASPGVTFHSSVGSLSSTIVAELNDDTQILAQYGATNQTLHDFYTNQIATLKAQLQSMGLLDEQKVDLNNDGDFNDPGEDTFLPVDAAIMVVTVDPIFADAGRIFVTGDELGGTGQFISPSDANVTITNYTPAFLNIMGVTIPDETGGLYFNGDLWVHNSDIQTKDNANVVHENDDIHTGGSPISDYVPLTAAFTALPNPGTSAPQIVIANKLDVGFVNIQRGVTYPWPDLTLVSLNDGGTGIDAPSADVVLDNKPTATSEGNINQFAPIVSHSLVELAGGTLFINLPQSGSKVETGGVPYKAWDAVDTGSYDPGNPAQTAAGVVSGLAGRTEQDLVNFVNNQTPDPTKAILANKIIIKANFVNINGTVQSGQADYTLTLGQQAIDDIQAILDSGATDLSQMPNESTGDFTVYFDPTTKRIEVQDRRVSGGDIEITGNVVNTANGQFIVLGGYGSLTINNNTGYDLGLHRLDVSTPGSGTLFIHDTSRDQGNHAYVTLYQETNGALTVTTDDGINPATVQNNVAHDTGFSPRSDWRYSWTVGADFTTHLETTITDSSWIGLINLGEDITHWDTTIPVGVPRLLGAGPYYYIDPSNSQDAYHFASTEVTTSAPPQPLQPDSVTQSTTWYGTTTITAVFKEDIGTEDRYTHDISAHRDIGVHFIGHTSGSVTVNSQGNVYIEGQILNPSGTTSITTQGSILTQGAEGIVGGDRVVLSAQTGLGTAATPLQVKVGGDAFTSLDASTANGNINIAQVAGALAIDQVNAQTLGTVTLSSKDNISVAQKDNSNWYEGLVSGGAITLNAGAGIGNDTTHPLVVDTPLPPNLSVQLQDKLTATALGNIYVQEKSGDLRVDSITTSGNVWVSVPNGSLIDANQSQVRDDRTYAELSAGVWSDLGLTANTGYDQKLANTIDSFVGAKSQEYETYWSFRHMQPDGGVTYDSGFVVHLSAAENAYYTSYYTGLGYNPAQVSAAITTLETARTSEYHTLNATYGAGGTYVTTNDPTFVPDTYVDGVAISGTVTFDHATNTITRVDGGTWAGLTVGMDITLAAASGQTSVNATGPGVTYHITALTSTVITISGATPLQNELDAAMNPKPISVVVASKLAHATVDFDGAAHTITRTDGGDWTGFTIGMSISIAADAGATTSNATASGTAYLITNISGNVLTVTPPAGFTMTTETGKSVVVADKFVYKATQAEKDGLTATIHKWTDNELLYAMGSGLLKDVTSTVVNVEDPNIVGNNVTLLTHNSVGLSGGNVIIDVSTLPITMTTDQHVALAAAERQDVQFLGGAIIHATVNFDAGTNTITRTDPGGWSGLSVGMYLTIGGDAGQHTQNETTSNAFPKITAINGNVITVDGGLATESGKAVTVAPVVLDPAFQAVPGAPILATVDFVANTISTPGQIHRVDAGSWLADGLQVGDLLRLTGSTSNSTTGIFTYKIAALTADTITLGQSSNIFAEAGQTVTITRGVEPVITTIKVGQSDDVNVNATGKIDITAGKNVLLGSTVTIKLDSVVAGDTTTGDNIRIKGSQSILDVSAGGPDIRGRDTVLEAANGSIGQKSGPNDKPITLDSVNGGTLTARADGLVYIDAVKGAGVHEPGDMNIESIFSATSDAFLVADGSILDALNNDFTKVKAHHIDLTAKGLNGNAGTIGQGGAPANYLDVNGLTSVTAVAAGSIWISQTDGSLNVDHILSQTGDVDLRAAFSILDRASLAYDNVLPSLPATDVFGRNIRLTAQTGGIGEADNALDIDSQYSGAGTLTSSSNALNTYIIEVLGDLLLNTVSTGAAQSAFITAPTGSILNGAAPGQSNVLAGNTRLFAANDIGQSANRIQSKVGHISAISTTGSTWVDNAGDLSIGGSFSGDPDGVVSGGSTTITASSPVTLTQSIISGGSVLVVAHDDALDGNNPATDDVPDNLIVNSKDINGNPLFIQAVGGIRLLAGDDLTVESGALLQSGAAIELQGDWKSVV